MKPGGLGARATRRILGTCEKNADGITAIFIALVAIFLAFIIVATVIMFVLPILRPEPVHPRTLEQCIDKAADTYRECKEELTPSPEWTCAVTLRSDVRECEDFYTPTVERILNEPPR